MITIVYRIKTTINCTICLHQADDFLREILSDVIITYAVNYSLADFMKLILKIRLNTL